MKPVEVNLPEREAGENRPQTSPGEEKKRTGDKMLAD